MKKIVLFLVTLTVITNVSYASFPVVDKEQIEILEAVEAPIYGESQPIIWGILSLSFAVLSLLLLPNWSTMLILALLSVIFGIIGLTNEVNGMEIVGLVLGILMTIITGSVAGIVFLFRNA